jgi:ribosomal-protein-alanine N-acetyltransferase
MFGVIPTKPLFRRSEGSRANRHRPPFYRISARGYKLIRLAIPADIPQLLALDRQSPTAAHWTEQQYRQLFAPANHPPRIALIANASPADSSSAAASSSSLRESQPEAILGFLIALHVAPEWELENIVVAPTARRQGIGKQLLHDLLAAAHETNSESVFLEVRESNSAARALYEHAGFAAVGRRPSYYADPQEDAVLYRFARAFTR